MGGMEWVRKTYGVPAGRGRRVVYSGGVKPQTGTIRSASNGRLNIQLDGTNRPRPFHPTWELKFLQ